MSFISESVPDLLGGVSQLAPQRREANEVESMVNCQLRPAEGVTKRPPTKWIAEVAASASAYSGAFVHAINKNADERYWVIVLDGDLKVFNAVTGAEVTVTFPDGKTYLDVVGSPNEKFRLATFNDTTVIVNRETVVDQGASLSSERGQEALIVVRQTDFGVRYNVGLNFSTVAATLFGGRFTENIQSTIAEANGGNAWILDTEIVAQQIYSRMQTTWGSSGTNALDLTLKGSSIHVKPGTLLTALGATFKLGVWDGLANQGLNLLQDSIQGVEDLPADAPVGFKIKVEGNPNKTLDDVWYEYTADDSWKETVAPGIPVNLDPATMPLELVANPDFLTANTLAQAPSATQSETPHTTYTTAMLQTQDGTASTRAQAIMSPAPTASVERYWNLGDAEGGDVVVNLSMLIDQTKVVSGGLDPTDPAGGHYAGDLYDWELAYDDGLGGGFVAIESEPIGNWLGTAVQFNIASNLTDVPKNADLRLTVTSNSGNKGSIVITPDLNLSYDVREGQRVTLPTSHYAPSTAMSATINGTAWSHTYTAGGTRAAYLTALKTSIEAYGGAALTVTIDTVAGLLDINNDDGSFPTLTLFTFDDNLDLTTELFNGGVDFTTFGLAVSDVITNTTDSSAATISAIATTIITHGALSGGVNDVWADGDAASATKSSTTEFICRQPTWPDRQKGTLETNKWPSFVDGTINEVAFLKNRLVFLSDENVAMSEVDEFFNFFRSSTIDVLDSDRIDVALSGNKASALHTAFVWNETLLTWSELGQFVVNGEPFLSPNTVRREATTSYKNTRKVKPYPSERGVYFLTEGNEYCQLWDYTPTTEDASSAEGNRLSVQVPRYMPGTPRGLLAVSDPETVLVLTATDPEKLYVYSHLTQDQQRKMGGWHEWSFAGVTQILGIGSIDNEVSLIFERDDGKVHLEVLDMWELSESTVDGYEDSDDQTTPPNHAPLTVTLADDKFTEASQIFLSAHTPDSGFTAWETNMTESGNDGAHVGLVSGHAQFNMGGVAGQGYRCTGDVGDGDMHVWADINKTVTSAGEIPFFTVLVNASNSGSYYREGLGFRVSEHQTTHSRIYYQRFYQGTVRESGVLERIAWANGTGKRIGMRRVGQLSTFYEADIGTGANEVALAASFTWGTDSTTGLSALADGSHKGVQVFNEATVSPLSNVWTVDELFIEGDGVTSETIFTPDGLCGDDFPTITGIDEAGNEVTLTPNGDCTLSWPTTDDKSSENIRMGIPVASSIELSTLYHRKNFGPNAGTAEMRGATYISLLQLGLLDTTSLTFTVDITGHVSFTQTYAELNSLDAEIFHSRVGGRNNEVTLTISDSTAANFKIVGYDWEGTYYNRTRRLS